MLDLLISESQTAAIPVDKTQELKERAEDRKVELELKRYELCHSQAHTHTHTHN